MLRNALLAAIIMLSASVPLFAQEKKIELVPYVGYTASSGVTINNTEIEEDVIANKLTPQSGFSFGLNFNYFLTEGMAVGFNFSEQNSNLEAGLNDGSKRVFTDMKVDNFHGIFTYNFADEDEQFRPFVFGGLGATHYRFSPIEGQNIDSNTRFSTTWGGGVKMYINQHVGIRGQLRWTPTYIRSDSGGIWCSPYYPWACWVLPNDHYSHQADFSAGVVFRF